MCQMSIILKHGNKEDVVLENASLLEVTDEGIRVSALLEESIFIQGATVSSIDFLQSRLIVTKKEGRHVMDPKTTIAKLKILLPHWIEHNRSHGAEFEKWAASALAEKAGPLADLLARAAANTAATDAILKSALAEVGGSGEKHPHHHHD